MIIYTDPDTGNVASATLSSSVPDGVTWHDVDAPEDREFREAWVINAGLLEFDTVIIDRIKVLKEGMRLINLLFPAIDNIDDIKLIRENWLSIAPAARQATADFQQLIDLYTTTKDAITNQTPFDNVVWP